MARKLATIETISEVLPHNNADQLELAKVRGWQVVIRKGEFKQGDFVVFCEIDSRIPHELAPFLSKGQEPRVYEGVPGERLRTVRLRGELSQGLVLPIPKDWQNALFVIPPESGYIEIGGTVMFQLGADVTELLGIQKWEPPISAQLAGQIGGNFPSFIRKTDQERCVEGNTVVETDDGPKTIKEIVDTEFSGKVLSYESLINQNVWRKVVGWSEMTPQPNEWVKITTRSGKFMIVTKNHKVYLPSLDIYREARFLQCGDKVRIA